MKKSSPKIEEKSPKKVLKAVEISSLIATEITSIRESLKIGESKEIGITPFAESIISGEDSYVRVPTVQGKCMEIKMFLHAMGIPEDSVKFIAKTVKVKDKGKIKDEERVIRIRITNTEDKINLDNKLDKILKSIADVKRDIGTKI